MAQYLVSGGAGFIGSSMVRELLRRDECVRVVDNLSTGRRQNLEEVLPQIELLERDITDLEGLRPIFNGVDYVLHMAALPSVPRSIEDPVTSHRVNIDGALNVLLAARDAKVRRVVMEPDPISPYGVTKLTGEYYSRVYKRLRTRDRVSAVLQRVWTAARPDIAVLGRSFCFHLRAACGPGADDLRRRGTVAGFHLCGQRSRGNATRVQKSASFWEDPERRHGGPRDAQSGYAVLQKLAGAKVDPVCGPPRKGDIQHSLADIRQAQEVMGYKPKVLLEEGLQRTVAWYKENQERFYADR